MSSDDDQDDDQDGEIITIGSDSPFEWTDEEIEEYIELMKKRLNE